MIKKILIISLLMLSFPINIKATNYIDETQEDVNKEESDKEESNKEEVIEKSRQFILTIEGSDNKRLSDVTVSFYSDSNKLITKLTSKNGIIKIEDIDIGRYYYIVDKVPNNYIKNNNKTVFKVNESEDIINETLILEKINTVLRVKVLDDNNNAYKNTKINIYKKIGSILKEVYNTDDDGVLRIYNLQDGDYYLKVINYNCKDNVYDFTIDNKNKNINIDIVCKNNKDSDNKSNDNQDDDKSNKDNIDSKDDKVKEDDKDNLNIEKDSLSSVNNYFVICITLFIVLIIAVIVLRKIY